MNPLTSLLNELESKIPLWDKLDLSVSASPVGWHIEHSLLVIKRIIKAVESSDPANYKWKFNLNRNYVFTFRKIPRGKGKAPKSVTPAGLIEPTTLAKELEAVRATIPALDSLQPDHYFDHPYFGMLNLKAARKFLVLHTKHHLAIINDIIQ